MIDTVCFMICLAVVIFCCMFVGWLVGYAEAKKKYRKEDV